jgi:hypothetical protein
MPTPKPFTTNTVETKNSVVDDRLKPNAEMHILVGGPYKDASGEEHRYGHTALRIKTSKLDLTYDFGRYGKISGTFGESGEGILRVWNVFNPYIQGEVALQRKTTGFVYLIFDHQAIAAINYFENLTKSGHELTGKNTSSRKVYKLATDYHATGPNCTTISMDGARQAVPKIDTGSEKFNKPGDVLSMAERLALSASGGSTKLFLPDNLLKFLNVNPIKPTRIDTYGKGK